MARLDRAYGLPEGSLAGAAFAPERLGPAVIGLVTDERWRSAVAGDLTGACGSPEQARALTAEWTRQVGRVDWQVLDLLTAVRHAVPVVLVSNATTRLEGDLARWGVLGAVDAVVNSARIGVAKPEPRIYRLAARRAGAVPSRCLFVDDTLSNVTAARAAGMTGLHYRQVQDLRDALGPLVGPAG